MEAKKVRGSDMFRPSLGWTCRQQSTIGTLSLSPFLSPRFFLPHCRISNPFLEGEWKLENRSSSGDADSVRSFARQTAENNVLAKVTTERSSSLHFAGLRPFIPRYVDCFVCVVTGSVKFKLHRALQTIRPALHIEKAFKGSLFTTNWATLAVDDAV